MLSEIDETKNYRNVGVEVIVQTHWVKATQLLFKVCTDRFTSKGQIKGYLGG